MLKAIIGVGGGSAVYLFGGFDLLFQTLLAFIVLDMVTGMGSAWYTGTFQSREMYRGLFRKVMALLLVVVVVFIDRLILSGALEGFDGVDPELFGVVNLRTAVVGYLILREIISIFENLDKADMPIPGFLKRALGKVVNLMDDDTANEIKNETSKIKESAKKVEEMLENQPEVEDQNKGA
jgi:toxin secretion/phage lysis holin